MLNNRGPNTESCGTPHNNSNPRTKRRVNFSSLPPII